MTEDQRVTARCDQGHVSLIPLSQARYSTAQCPVCGQPVDLLPEEEKEGEAFHVTISLHYYTIPAYMAKALLECEGDREKLIAVLDAKREDGKSCREHGAAVGLCASATGDGIAIGPDAKAGPGDVVINEEWLQSCALQPEEDDQENRPQELSEASPTQDSSGSEDHHDSGANG